MTARQCKTVLLLCCVWFEEQHANSSAEEGQDLRYQELIGLHYILVGCAKRAQAHSDHHQQQALRLHPVARSMLAGTLVGEQICTAQVPVLITLVMAVRRMALQAWPGFDSGGVLWFQDLTLPALAFHPLSAPLGALGIAVPAITAVALIANVDRAFSRVPSGWLLCLSAKFEPRAVVQTGTVEQGVLLMP